MYLKCLNIYGIHIHESYNAFNVYRRDLAPGIVSLTGDRAQGDDSKHWAYSTYLTLKYLPVITLCMLVENFVICQ